LYPNEVIIFLDDTKIAHFTQEDALIPSREMNITASMTWRGWNGHNISHYKDGKPVYYGYSIENIPLPTSEKFMLIDYVKVY